MTTGPRHASGLTQALRQYQRLCADPASQGYNQQSALALLDEGLTHAPVTTAILEALAQATTPMTAIEVGIAVGIASQGNISTQLGRLAAAGVGLTSRTWHPRHDCEGHWLYTLSDLGQQLIARRRAAQERRA